MFVDSETMAFEAVENPAIGAPSGAGIQAAQFVVDQGVQAAISGNVGPNAFDVLAAAGVHVYLFGGGTVREAVEAVNAGRLSGAGGPSARAHSGMGRGRGMSRSATAAAPASPEPSVAQAPELDELKETAAALRAQVADLMQRLDQLEKKEGG
jgi:predicted Fe-Mo cluster-binding NifX family protein